jgi:hypothetical protein
MMDGIRQILRGKWGSRIAIGVLSLGVLGAGVSLYGTFGGSQGAGLASDRVYMCTQTGKSYRHELTIGEKLPVYSPHSDRNTGYPAELCYWTTDGKISQEPTPVLLNSYKGEKEPTFCPTCSRLVVGLNPPPEPGSRPPPRREDMRASR